MNSTLTHQLPLVHRPCAPVVPTSLRSFEVSHAATAPVRWLDARSDNPAYPVIGDVNITMFGTGNGTATTKRVPARYLDEALT